MPELESNMRVVVLHGIWMNRWTMRLLGRRLRARGFDVSLFGYPFLRGSIEQNADRLQAFVCELGDEPVHFVAHSLGGLVLLNCLQRYPSVPAGRVVLLGSPVNGSRLARRLASCRLSRWLLGRNTGSGGLLKGAEPVPGVEVGVVSGTRRLGVSMLFGGLPAPHDGAVELHETVYEGAVDSLSMHISHLGLILSRLPVGPICRFLQSGRFS